MLSHVWLWDPINCSISGLPVLQYLPDLFRFMSTELVMLSNHLILWCSLLLLPSTFPSNQGLFQWVGSLHQVAKVLELQSSVLSRNIGLISLRNKCFDSLQTKVLSRVFSSTTIQRHQFFTQPSLWSNSHIHTWPLEKP